VLHRIHMDLCELAPGCCFSTMIDEATRFARVGILHRKSDTLVVTERRRSESSILTSCIILHVIMLQVGSLCFCTASQRTMCRIF
jgi:hypothetical protein